MTKDIKQNGNAKQLPLVRSRLPNAVEKRGEGTRGACPPRGWLGGGQKCLLALCRVDAINIIIVAIMIEIYGAGWDKVRAGISVGGAGWGSLLAGAFRRVVMSGG